MSGRSEPADLRGFHAATRGARKVLVVDLGFLGDTVHLVPALWELRRNYPEAALHVLTSPLGAAVLALASCVDRAWAVELAPQERSLRQHAAVLGALRRERFDVAFNFSGADRTLFMTLLAGARRNVTHEAGRKHFWSRWLLPDRLPRRSTGLPVFEQRRAVLAECGLELGPARFDLSVPDEARRWAAEHVPEGAIHLSVSAAQPLNEWPLSHWIALARRLLEVEPGLQLLATSGASPRDFGRSSALQASLPGPRLRVFPGLTLPRTAALLERSALHVGANSGLTHLAAALGAPTLSLFRSYRGVDEWVPRGPGHRLLFAPCACDEARRVSCRVRGEAECLAGLSPDVVLAALRRILTGMEPFPN